MTLSRWRRVVTGVAAGVIVLCAALIGASFRDDGSGVSVASDLRPANVIPIEEDPIDADDDAGSAADEADADATDDDTTDSADGTAVDATDTTADTTGDSDTNAAGETTDDDALTDPVQVLDDPEEAEASDTADSAGDDTGAADPADDGDDTNDTAGDDTESLDDADAAEPDAADTDDAEEAAASDQTPEAPLTASDDALGTGGGVDDAECALDRLVIYAGARRGGVAGSIRSALTQAGFGAGCPTPVTVLASNCPLQFSGVLGPDSGYDPTKSFVAASDSVDRETMTAVMSSVGYSGNQIDILDFGFVNADQPGEQWIAIFVPPSFEGWEGLAGRAGLAPTSSSLCAPSGQLAGVGRFFDWVAMTYEQCVKRERGHGSDAVVGLRDVVEKTLGALDHTASFGEDGIASNEQSRLMVDHGHMPRCVPRSGQHLETEDVFATCEAADIAWDRAQVRFAGVGGGVDRLGQDFADRTGMVAVVMGQDDMGNIAVVQAECGERFANGVGASGYTRVHDGCGVTASEHVCGHEPELGACPDE